MTVIKRHWFGLLFATAVLVRLPQLTATFWYDESWTQWISGLPWDRMMAALTGDVHPPALFVLTWLIGRVTLQPVALRLVPLAFGLLCLPAARKLAEAMGLATAAQVVALLLLALSPWQIYYADELRMYSLLEFAFIMAMLAIVRRRWGWLAVAMTAMLYTQNYGFVYCLVLGLWALWQERADIRPPLMAGAVALMLYAPWGFTGLRAQLTAVSAGYWITPPSASDVLLTIYDWLFGNIEGALEVLGMALTIWLLAASLLRGDRRLLWLMLAPIGLALAPSLWRPIYLNRPLLPCAIPFYLLIGQELARLRLPGRVVAAGFLVPALALAAVTDQGRALMSDRYHIGEVARFLQQAQPGDAIYHLGLASMVELRQFNLSEPQYLWNYPMSLQAGGYSLETRQALGIDERPLADVTARRIWLIVPINGYGGYADGAGADQLLADHPSREVLSIKGQYNFGVEVYDYENQTDR